LGKPSKGFIKINVALGKMDKMMLELAEACGIYASR